MICRKTNQPTNQPKQNHQSFRHLNNTELCMVSILTGVSLSMSFCSRSFILIYIIFPSRQDFSVVVTGDFSLKSECGLDGLVPNSDTQFPHTVFHVPGDCSKSPDYKWYHRYLHASHFFSFLIETKYLPNFPLLFIFTLWSAIIIILFLWEIFPPSIADGFSLEFDWQKFPSSHLDSSQDFDQS